ncbi:uncharacterized protein EI90DRAFT_3129053 [Cantharellus anzutake]|uniref:uncharacterized protein n=1 Tax=Cantharellus anzutake TaxID=1750568 RepID=UPI0019068608|nr:uncharacterized protein EI90DRAFT_3129053 [Cantharellus anzutake]KAF8325217.1 hypothetical protein EI90DRAFT_3129053 [Cantharellus anzutake]
MSRSTYVQRTIRNTIVSEKSFKETLDSFLYELRFFHPVHADKMIEQAMEAKDPKVFDTLAEEASGRFGYLSFGDHKVHRYLNKFNPNRPVLESHAIALGTSPRAYSMTKHNQEATINFPLRITVTQRPNDDRASVTWDLPSSQIPNLHLNKTLANAAFFVDDKFEELIRFCSGTMDEKKYKKILSMDKGAKVGAWKDAGGPTLSKL